MTTAQNPADRKEAFPFPRDSEMCSANWKFVALDDVCRCTLLFVIHVQHPFHLCFTRELRVAHDLYCDNMRPIAYNFWLLGSFGRQLLRNSQFGKFNVEYYTFPAFSSYF